MKNKPLALMLADELEQTFFDSTREEAACELRRIHFENLSLHNALKNLLESNAPDRIPSRLWDAARALVKVSKSKKKQHNPTSDVEFEKQPEFHPAAMRPPPPIPPIAPQNRIEREDYF